MALLQSPTSLLSLLLLILYLTLPHLPSPSRALAANRTHRHREWRHSSRHPWRTPRFSHRRSRRSKTGPGREDGGNVTSAGQVAGKVLSLHGNGKGVMTGTIKVYLIYYGNWSARSKVIENFVESLSRFTTTPKGPGHNRAFDWWRVVMEYANKSGNHVGQVVFGGRSFDKYSQGSNLTGRVDAVVAKALSDKALPLNPKGAYMVLPSADVVEHPGTGFCAGTYPFPDGIPVGYCGWHWFMRHPDVAYAFIGNAAQCVKRCGHLEGYRHTPNGDVGIDAMVNVLAHELAELATDRNAKTGWYSRNGNENADLCNRQWGATNVSEDGSYMYNMVGQRGMRWLVQQIWDLSSQSCRMQLPQSSTGMAT